MVAAHLDEELRLGRVDAMEPLHQVELVPDDPRHLGCEPAVFHGAAFARTPIFIADLESADLRIAIFTSHQIMDEVAQSALVHLG